MSDTAFIFRTRPDLKAGMGEAPARRARWLGRMTVQDKSKTSTPT